jgi:hypothetical protein
MRMFWIVSATFSPALLASFQATADELETAPHYLIRVLPGGVVAAVKAVRSTTFFLNYYHVCLQKPFSRCRTALEFWSALMRMIAAPQPEKHYFGDTPVQYFDHLGPFHLFFCTSAI